MDVDDEYIYNDNNVGEQKGYHHATDYALPYVSKWSRVVDDEWVSRMLAHMNCSYLGEPGMPPTLLSLKRHAQSLAVLIQYLQPSVSTGAVDGKVLGDFDPNGYVVDGVGRASQDVDGGNIPAASRTYMDIPDRRLNNGEAFDWLHDLTNPYFNDDPDHHRPLNALMNEVKSSHDLTGPTFHCPLTDVVPRGLKEDVSKNDIYLNPKDTMSKHYASHHNLVMHANECLELLDHEFSATGGLLSIIPPDGEGMDKDDFEAAKNTLLGQLLLHTQGMYLRMHEFELDVGNMRDALAKDAVVPMQSLRAGGPDASSGREIVVGQDRFVIVNANNDTWKYMQDDFDVKEQQRQAIERVYREAGASGEAQWMKDRGGDLHARGIVALDYTTRYYRLMGAGHSTIFIAPGFGLVPSTEQTPKNERNPGVLGLVQPRWPERVSDWERKYKKQIADATALTRANFDLRREKHDKQEQIDALQHALDAAQTAMQAANEALTGVKRVAGEDLTDAQQEQAQTTLLDQYARLQRQFASAQANLDAAERARRDADLQAAIQRDDDLSRRNNELRDYLAKIHDTMITENIENPALTILIQTARASRFAAAPTPATGRNSRTTAGTRFAAGF
ncbi:hypothetical protein N0V82_000219 [Gnomoniopsis sp. IMI 355080]|nr:hypothetical protein N0V82_000219 [Gnomoniopsis sp. IMI 355080]